MYLVLGCDDVGFSTASMLKERGVEVVVVDKNAKRIRDLKLTGYNAVLGDFGRPDVLREAGMAGAEMVLIMTPNISTTRTALGAINRLKAELKVDPVVVARVLDEAEADEVKRLGASDALPSSQLLANFAIGKFERLNEMVKEKRLRALLRELVGRKMAIVLQTNPDPDSIASGVALQRYVKAFGVDADIIYDGVIGHPQNRALVNLLELNLLEANRVDFNTYRSWALVDVATHANCALPKEIAVPTIVIDHHTVPSGEVKARFQDLTRVGAASTLLTNYLRYAAVEVDPATAAALVVGILTDTMNFTRGTTPLDFDAFEYLMKLADTDVLRRLQTPTVTPDAFYLFAQAIKVSKIKEGYLTANLGEVKDRDLLAQAADFLLIREDVSTAFVYGICDNIIYASARTKDVTLHLGQILKRAFSEIGSAGGHARLAGATIPLQALGRVSKARLRKVVDREVGKKFLETVGVVRVYKRKRKRTKKK